MSNLLNKTAALVVFLLTVLVWNLDSRAELVLAVDFGVSDSPLLGASGNRVQPGFQDFSTPRQVGAPGYDRYDQGELPLSKTFGIHTVQVRVPDGFRAVYVDYVIENTSTPADLGPMASLVEDGIFSPSSFSNRPSTIQLEVLGLAPGDYSMTTWHHKALIEGTKNELDLVLDPNGAKTIVGTNLQWTEGVSAVPLSHTFSFSLGGSGAMSLDIMPSATATGGSTVVLNGFSISSVPEPSAVGCYLFALPWIARRYRVQH